MKHIIITGHPNCGHSKRGRELYTEHTKLGEHVIYDAPGDLRNSLPERSLSAATVLITVRDADRPFSETVFE